MTASPPPHPTDQILYAYGLGKLDDPAASAVDTAFGSLRRLPAAGVRALGR